MEKLLELVEMRHHFDGLSLIERMEECRVEGVSIALVENFEVTETFVHGCEKRANFRQINRETRFQTASISKPVFAAAVLRLVQKGVLDLDADIAQYLTDYELPTFDGKKHKITLRQLLSHEAGLNLSGFSGYVGRQYIPTIEEILKGEHPANHEKLKLKKLPNTAFEYSGGGYTLAQKIVMDVTGQDFCELMDEIILKKCKMKNSSFRRAVLDDGFACGYNAHDLEIEGEYCIMPELAAAGLWASPTDIANFGIGIMKSLNGKGRIMKKTSAEQMVKKAHDFSEYGVGFEIGESKMGSTFGHSGSNVGYTSNMIFEPVSGCGIVVMVNSSIGWHIPFDVTNAFKEMFGF